MTILVIEQFRNGDADAVGRRFREKGRMLPAGVEFVVSWIDPASMTCYQIMEADSPESIQPWTQAWEDLVEFQVVPVLPSPQFWSRLQA